MVFLLPLFLFLLSWLSLKILIDFFPNYTKKQATELCSYKKYCVVDKKCTHEMKKKKFDCLAFAAMAFTPIMLKEWLFGVLEGFYARL